MPRDEWTPKSLERCERVKSLVAAGMTNRQIAARLEICERTVTRYKARELPEQEDTVDTREVKLARKIYSRCLKSGNLKMSTDASKLLEIAIKTTMFETPAEETEEVGMARATFLEALENGSLTTALGCAELFNQAVQIQLRLEELHPEPAPAARNELRIVVTGEGGKKYVMLPRGEYIDGILVPDADQGI